MKNLNKIDFGFIFDKRDVTDKNVTWRKMNKNSNKI